MIPYVLCSFKPRVDSSEISRGLNCCLELEPVFTQYSSIHFEVIKSHTVFGKSARPDSDAKIFFESQITVDWN